MTCSCVCYFVKCNLMQVWCGCDISNEDNNGLLHVGEEMLARLLLSVGLGENSSEGLHPSREPTAVNANNLAPTVLVWPLEEVRQSRTHYVCQ